MPETHSKSRFMFKLSSSTLLLLALLTGVLCGLFFGEMVGWMNHVGRAVILMMQMTVFPYIVVSLVGGIGKLDTKTARMLFSRAGLIMVLMWLLGLVIIFLSPIIFPEVESASFFSSSIVSEPDAVDYFKLYIPSNPFESMAYGAVPAVVLFSILLGLSLIGGKNNKPLLDLMEATSEGIAKITQKMIKILPLGVFAMSASAAGTLSIEEFTNLQVYFASRVVVCLVIAFWVFPYLVACLTPVKYRELVSISRTAMITAFATGNVFILLPVIMEECKQVMKNHDALDEKSVGMVDILIPIAYSFPTVGKLTVIGFVLFAGWFSGVDINASEYPELAISGLLSLFGSVYVAIPFMLNSLQIPSDLTQLYVMSAFLTGRFTALVTVMHLMALTLLTISIFNHVIRLKLINFIRYFAITTCVIAVTFIGSKMLMTTFIDNTPQTSKVISNMQVASDVAVDVAKRYPVIGQAPEHALASMQEIQKRGLLRIGYQPGNVPFSYRNNSGALVGFDVTMAQMLATDMGVQLEFIPYKRNTLIDSLNRGYFDIAMSGLGIDLSYLAHMGFSETVLTLNHSLLVADHLVKSFDTPEKIKQHKGLKIAYFEHDSLIERAKPLYPDATFEQISRYKKFFTQKPGTYDALLISAEAGSAWSLFYPQYGVAVFNKSAKYPMAYAVAWENTALLRYLDNWIKLRKSQGSVDKTYDYWMLGKGASDEGERWSILKDVLQIAL